MGFKASLNLCFDSVTPPEWPAVIPCAIDQSQNLQEAGGGLEVWVEVGWVLGLVEEASTIPMGSSQNNLIILIDYPTVKDHSFVSSVSHP